MKLSLIAAIDQNNGIGMDNKIPWHISEDLKNFKRLTLNNAIIMGRLTYESLPNGALEDRMNIVITKNNEYNAPNCYIVTDLQKFLNSIKHDTEVFVIGGASLYEQTIRLANKLYITQIHNTYICDKFFPKISLNDWKLIEYKDSPRLDDDDDDCNTVNIPNYTFKIYERK
jgi:dihydrofolate reductase